MYEYASGSAGPSIYSDTPKGDEEEVALIDLYRQAHCDAASLPLGSLPFGELDAAEWDKEVEEHIWEALCEVEGRGDAEGLEEQPPETQSCLPIADADRTALAALPTPQRKRTAPAEEDLRDVRRRLRRKSLCPPVYHEKFAQAGSMLRSPSSTQSSHGTPETVGRRGYSEGYQAHRKACVARFRNELRDAFQDSDAYYKHLAERFRNGPGELKVLWRRFAAGELDCEPSDTMLAMGAPWPWTRQPRPLPIRDALPEEGGVPPRVAAEHERGPPRAAQGPRAPQTAPRAARPRDEEGAEDEARVIKRKAFMFTYNGPWLSEENSVLQLVRSEVVSPAREAQFRRDPAVIALWDRFRVWWRELVEREDWWHSSAKMELCLHAKEPEKNIVHFHLSVVDKAVRRGISPRQLRSIYAFDDQTPCVVPCSARGARVDRAIYHMNYYCQVYKYGTLFADTDWPAMLRDNPVEQAYIFGLWKSRKMSADQAISEIIRARGTRRHCLQREIEWNIAYERKRWEEAERQVLEMFLPHNPVVMVPEVGAWIRSFTDLYGYATRFRLLVLVGPSQIGKTVFAKSLFGKDRTLVVTCGPDLSEPHLKNFVRGTHRAIVYDEATAEMVVRNRALFQSGIDPRMLAQSKCQEHAYWVWLYGIPQIVTCNEWPGERCKPDELAWLEANSVVIRRGPEDFLYHRHRLQPLRDA